MGRPRTDSFSNIDPEEASGVLGSIIKENKIFLGGSSVGKGLHKAARFYLKERISKAPLPEYFELPGAEDIVDGAERAPLEESFYVLDIGVVVSQVYQWRKYFPRVEPFYAVKCNPDPVIVRTLAVLGCSFDCASRNEIRLVQQCSKDLDHTPDIIYANPCKSRQHLLEAVCKGVRMVTFDNVSEVIKCASISKNIKLIMRIITDDRGSQCRLSSKFGAPSTKWRTLLKACKDHGLQCVGVSFHVGSGCRDSSRYHTALQDARKIFDMAKKDFGFEMNILDIGGGFPGETHSLWNPTMMDEEEDEQIKLKEGTSGDLGDDQHFMFFNEIAEQVSPKIDELFPPESGVRIIGEPGRFLAAACATLVCSVIAVRDNSLDSSFKPEPVDDTEVSKAVAEMTREEEIQMAEGATISLKDEMLGNIVEELADYSRMFARQSLAQQETDVYNDSIDIYKQDFETAADILGPPEDHQLEEKTHTVEGMNYPLVAIDDEKEENHPLITLAAAGEAAVNGVVMQAVADSSPLQDDYSYYINDGVYGAFNNIMFDHAIVRPRVLRGHGDHSIFASTNQDGFRQLDSGSDNENNDHKDEERLDLYASTVFGPTCDSIDVVARSVLLPKLKIGDWMYFQNMGAYTMAASSSFNGFVPSEKFYVCSVQPEYFEGLIAGPDPVAEDEKKEDGL